MAVSVPCTGGCACGAVRYESSAEPIFMFRCRCRDCQRATGGPFAANVIFPAAAFTFTTGEPAYYVVTSDAGNTTSRCFCSASLRLEDRLVLCTGGHIYAIAPATLTTTNQLDELYREGEKRR